MRHLLTFLTSVLFMNFAAASDQKVLSLSHDDLSAQAKQRALVEKYLSKEDLRGTYLTAAGKLGTLRALLQAKIFSSKQTYELQCMGVVLGDAFVQDMGFKWVIVQDSLGRDPALQYKNSKVLLFPLTMISKRLERGEDAPFYLGKNISARVPWAGLEEILRVQPKRSQMRRVRKRPRPWPPALRLELRRAWV